MDFSFDHQFDKHVVGIDEVGRGSWAGPVMACASLLNDKIPIDNRLDDSKKLSHKIRKEILYNLTKNSIFGIGEVSNIEIDQLGISNATFSAMEIALFNLIGNIKDNKDTIILIDGTVMPKFNKNFGFEVRLVKKGDSLSPSIAAASIYAKCARDELMIKFDKKFTGYGFSKNMGYGTKHHREKILLSGPTHIHRMTFSPMKNFKN